MAYPEYQMKNVAFPVRNSMREELGIYESCRGIEIFTDRELESGSAKLLGVKDFYGEVKKHYFVDLEEGRIEETLHLSGIGDHISRKLKEGVRREKRARKFRMPLVMAVANATPDSFFEGSRLDDGNSLLDSLLDSRPDIIDIGGESTRPGSIELSAKEEISRIEPVLNRVLSASDIPVSLDTRHPEVLEHFADRVQYANDISGFRDEHMIKIASEYSLKCITMHMRGEPSNMQSYTSYVDIVPEVISFLVESAEKLYLNGVKNEDIFVDPGIGFSKDFNGNLELLSEISSFDIGYGTLVGASRKSFIGKITGEDTYGRLPGTLAVTAFLASRGVDIIRVHDPKENMQLLKVLKAVNEGKHQL